MNATSGTWGGYTLRNVIPVSALAAGYKVRLTLTAPAGNNIVISNAYLQTQAASGDPYDYSTTPIQVFFSGVAGVTIPAGGSVVTDEVIVGVSGSTPIVFAAYFTTAASLRTATGSTGFASYYWAGNNTTTVNQSGGSSIGTNISALVSKVEVWT